MSAPPDSKPVLPSADRRASTCPGGLPGATLFQLEKLLRPIGREPHCLIGSSCIGASVLRVQLRVPS
jgi:hypothetical protein